MTKDKLILATFAVPLSGNNGSASMLLGLIDALKDSSHQITFIVYSYYPKKDAGLANNFQNVTVKDGTPLGILKLALNLATQRLLKKLTPNRIAIKNHEFNSCDAVFCLGGTTFADSMAYKSLWNALAAAPAVLAKKRLWFLSQTIGPFEKAGNRMLAKWALSHAHAIYGRGDTSTQNVKQSLKISAEYAPDLSLTMDFENSNHPAIANMRTLFERSHQTTKIAGITPNTIVEKKCRAAGIDYPKVLAEIAENLHQNKFFPVLIAHSLRQNTEATHNNDAPLCRLISDQLSCPHFLVGEELNPRELRLLVKELDLLVASRFHSMVSALATGVIPITIGWGNQKYVEVLAKFGASDLYIDYKNLCLEKFECKLNAVTKNSAKLKNVIMTNRSRQVDLARNTVNQIVYDIIEP